MNSPRTHHTIYPRDTNVTPDTVELSFAIQPPDRFQLIASLVSEYGSIRLASVSPASCEDNHVCIEMRAIVKIESILAERRDLRIVLQLDLILGYESRRPNVYQRMRVTIRELGI